MNKKAIIIGAGPAGLTAAYELLQRTDIIPVILEKSSYIGGISRTIDYKGNRMDMGPHRFFSKSDRVMNWWLKMMPMKEHDGEAITINYQNKSREINPDLATHEKKDPGNGMLVIQRLTRIYFLRKFFAYPIQLGLDTLRTLGLVRTIKILISFLWVRLFPRRPEKSLEDFIINKFGKELYLLFFKDYTEKVWGVPCHEISAEWGAQRIKGVSLSKAIIQALKNLRDKKSGKDLSQKNTETSLIEQFLYPRRGPGSLWEEVARQVKEKGGQIYLNQDVQAIYSEDGQITSVDTLNSVTGEPRIWEGEFFFSTMPVKELIAGMGDKVPHEVQKVAAGLQYRDFINVGILLKQLSAPIKGSDEYQKLELKDNWIYIQERDVKVGRLMIYNNWGDGMVKDKNTIWIGMEYFCNKTDEFWALDNATIEQMAILELEKMGLARVDDVLDITVQRMEKTYPAYFGTYEQFDQVKAFTDGFENLFLVGRNGMHKYNNADHSMLTAMVAVDNIMAGVTAKANLWSINTEQEYHEEKQAEKTTEVYTPQTMPDTSFETYLWKNKWNRAYVFFGLAAYIIQFIIFKFRYPFANYMPDSYSYIEAAARNLDVNMWPVAYSKFLRMVSVLTHSDTIVVGIQYMFLQTSSLLFLFTLTYFLKPGMAIKNVLYAFFLFNPIPLYLSNYISADAIFIGLSLLWMTSLVWILYLPRVWQIWVQGILLLFCFTVRYNAVYYPLVTVLAFILSKQSWGRKIAGIGFGSLLLASSFIYTSNKMYAETGQRQFSAFGGWQLANNALYMYEHISSKDRGPIPLQFEKLEKMVREHIDTLNRVKLNKDDTANAFFYLWSGKGPLVQYMVRAWNRDSTTPYFKRWASVAPLYSAYATHLIRKYPIQFCQRFILPNAIKYVTPPTEFLGIYNMGGDSVGKLAKDWFNYKSLKVKTHKERKKNISATAWYPIYSTLVNVFFLISLGGLVAFGGSKHKQASILKIVFLTLGLSLVNTMFSIFAAPIVLRYQLFPVLLNFCVSAIIFEYVMKKAKQIETG